MQMRSVLSTIILAALALSLGGLAYVQIKENDLTSIFGDPPRKADEALFSFELNAPARLTITNSSGKKAEFRKSGGLWYMISPTEDRADFRHLQSLVFASRQLIISESFDQDELSPKESGLAGGHYKINIIDGDGNQLAHYKLGKRSPWHCVANENGNLAETFFIQPIGSFADDHIYVCAGANARVLLDEGFPILRDHRPFLFNALQLANITVQSKNGEVVINRAGMKSPWRITKPLDLRTDTDALERLVSGLYSLEAPKIHDPGSITIPARPTGGAYMEVSLGFFDSAGKIQPKKVTLEVEAPATPESNTVFAKVTGRSSIFELPLTSANGLVSLSDLPITVNELRSHTLLSHPPSTLRSATIKTPEQDPAKPLLLALAKDPRTKRPRWYINRTGEPEPANEKTVYRLFTAITRDQILAFTSDAPAELAPFGLKTPAVSLTFEHSKNQKIEIDLGKGEDGNYYALRKDEPGVVQIDTGTFHHVATKPSSWRDSLLWSLPIITLKGFAIEHQGEPPLLLSYNFLTEQWAARREGKNVTSLLNKQRANILLDNLEGLRVTRWLGPDDEEAADRLISPTLSIEVAYAVEDDFGDEIATHRRLLNLTPFSYADKNQLFYGRLSGDPDYFILSKLAFDKLNVDLLEK